MVPEQIGEQPVPGRHPVRPIQTHGWQTRCLGGKGLTAGAHSNLPFIDRKQSHEQRDCTRGLLAGFFMALSAAFYMLQRL
jgi:hypothetical protein